MWIWQLSCSVNALSGCYLISTVLYALRNGCIRLVSMPSRAVTSFLLRRNKPIKKGKGNCVNALTGWYLISTSKLDSVEVKIFLGVSMPSRAVTSFLPTMRSMADIIRVQCQCPHGLLPHFYREGVIMIEEERNPCQCPHGLLPHFYREGVIMIKEERNPCQCPHGLLPHFYLQRCLLS